MPDASDFTRMKRMVASANAYTPAAPAVWVPRGPIMLPNILRSNKFTGLPSETTLGEWLQGGDPFTSLVMLLTGGDPSTQTGVLYSGGFP
jgi:hypothetical protein